MAEVQDPSKKTNPSWVLPATAAGLILLIGMSLWFGNTIVAVSLIFVLMLVLLLMYSAVAGIVVRCLVLLLTSVAALLPWGKKQPKEDEKALSRKEETQTNNTW